MVNASMTFADDADREFDGPVDDRGQPRIGMEPLDVETRFSDVGPTMYRWFWECPQRHAYCGPWRESRSHAYEEGTRWVAMGRL